MITVASQPLSALKHRVYSNEGNPALLAHLPLDAGKVLDVGCGAGANARLLHERGCRVWGITLSPGEADLAKPFCEAIQVADVEDGDFDFSDGFFDCMIFSHVLEHLVRPEVALKKLCRYLRTGGLVLIAVPNMAHWRIRLRLLRGDWRRDDSGPMDSTHLHFWSYLTAPGSILAPLQIRSRVAGDPAFPLWPLRRWAPTWSKRIDRCTGNLWPNLFATQTLLVAEKVSQLESFGS